MSEIFTKKITINKLEAILKFGVSCCGHKDDVVRVFLDTSVGCGLGCDYCWVADTKAEVSDEDEKLLDETVLKLIGKKQYNLKLMGQGDPLAFPSRWLNRLENYKGFNSLSISSIFPNKSNSGDQYKLLELAGKVYVSVIDPDLKHRAKMVPSALNIETATEISKRYADTYLHFTPTISNTEHDGVKKLAELALKVDCPIRLIRYHAKHNGNKVDTLEIAEQLADFGVAVSVSISAGVKNNTACGMFG